MGMKQTLTAFRGTFGLGVCLMVELLGGSVRAQELAPTPAAEVSALPAYEIAVVKDGDSWYFDAVVERLKAELTALAENRYTFGVKTLSAGHDPVNVRALLRQASADPKIDVLYASGVVATENAKRMTVAERTKPVLAGAVQFSDTAGLISSKGTSSVPNYTFITEPKRVMADLALLKRLTNATTLHIAIDRLIYSEFDKFEEARLAFERVLGTRLSVHTFNPTAEDALSAIPKDAKAVYVGLQPRMSSEGRRMLYQGLAERGNGDGDDVRPG